MGSEDDIQRRSANVEQYQQYLFLAVKTRGMNQNEVFYFQTVEIQWFAKGEMNCDYLLVSVFVRIFAN